MINYVENTINYLKKELKPKEPATGTKEGPATGTKEGPSTGTKEGPEETNTGPEEGIKPETKQKRSLGGIETPYKSFPLMTPKEFAKNREYDPIVIKPL